MNILGIIPARYESARFPGKPLADILGKTMIHRVYDQCLKTKSLSKVIVATDDQRIYNEVKRFGGEVMMTSHTHENGTARCAEVAINAEGFDYIINIQGDEPVIHREQIDELAELFKEEKAQIVTQAKKEADLSLLSNPNIVKLLPDENYFAKDFVRTLTTDKPYFYRHIGIYGFRRDVLLEIVKLAPTKNEQERKLEQMRWLDNDYRIKIGITEYESLSVDKREDLEKVVNYLLL